MVAVLIYGEYRDFDKAVKTWDFLKNYHCDYYFSTWDTSRGTPIISNMITDHLPKCTYDIVNKDSVYPTYPGDTACYIYYHWINLFRMIQDKKFDKIILIRTDLYYKKPNPLVKVDFKNDRIYGLYPAMQVIGLNPIKFFTNDQFFIGNYDVMVSAFDDLNDKHSHPTDEIYTTHYHFPQWLYEKNILIEEIDEFFPLGIGS
jgi:hypothetical protein